MDLEVPTRERGLSHFSRSSSPRRQASTSTGARPQKKYKKHCTKSVFSEQPPLKYHWVRCEFPLENVLGYGEPIKAQRWIKVPKSTGSSMMENAKTQSGESQKTKKESLLVQRPQEMPFYKDCLKIIRSMERNKGFKAPKKPESLLKNTEHVIDLPSHSNGLLCS